MIRAGHNRARPTDIRTHQLAEANPQVRHRPKKRVSRKQRASTLQRHRRAKTQVGIPLANAPAENTKPTSNAPSVGHSSRPKQQTKRDGQSVNWNVVISLPLARLARKRTSRRSLQTRFNLSA